MDRRFPRAFRQVRQLQERLRRHHVLAQFCRQFRHPQMVGLRRLQTHNPPQDQQRFFFSSLPLQIFQRVS